MNKQLNRCQVDVNAMYKEIALNMINPLEIVREAISNSIDADAENIEIIKYIDEEYGLFSIEFLDNGIGMSEEEIKDFFNLGSSNKESKLIGKKGLGSKTFFRSRRLEIITQKYGIRHKAVIDNPWLKLKNKATLEYSIEKINPIEGDNGTSIKIIGYSISHPEQAFDFDLLKDYILWRTAAGSFKNRFTFLPELRRRINKMTVSPVIVIKDKINDMIEEFENGRQSRDYCKTFGPFHRDTYIDGEYVSFQIYGTISGYNQRSSITNFKQGEGHKSRFGVILAKDFMYIENTKHTMIDDDNYNAYHIMVNSQNFELTSDRNSIRNKDSVEVKWVLEESKKIILSQICKIAKNTYFKLVNEEEVRIKKEKKIEDLQNRLNDYLLKEELIDFPITKIPENEAQVVAIFIAMVSTGVISEFKIGEYSTHSATDIIAENTDGSIELIEVEYSLSRLFEHGHPIDSFDRVVCWDIDLPENFSKILDGKNLTIRKDKEK